MYLKSKMDIFFKNEESGKDNINNSNVELRLFEASDKQEENLI